MMNNTTTMPNVDLYTASKALTARVKSYADAIIWGGVLRIQCEMDIAKDMSDIRGWEKLEGSMFSEEGRAKIAEAKERVATRKAEMQELLNREASFTTDTLYDKEFKKSYKSAQTLDDLCKIVRTWLGHYGLAEESVMGTELESVLVGAIRGEKAVNAKTAAKTLTEKGELSFTTNRSANEALKAFYAKLADEMVAINLIPLKDIPEEFKAHYEAEKARKTEEKKAKAKARKAEKKAQKTN